MLVDVWRGVRNFLVPGWSRSNGYDARALARQHAGTSGVVVDLRYPPTFHQLDRPTQPWASVVISVAGHEVHAGGMRGRPVWIGTGPGVHPVAVRSAFHEQVVLLSSEVTVAVGTVTRLVIRPEITRALRRTVVASASVE